MRRSVLGVVWAAATTLAYPVADEAAAQDPSEGGAAAQRQPAAGTAEQSTAARRDTSANDGASANDSVVRYRGGQLSVVDIERDLHARGAFVRDHHRDPAKLRDFVRRRVEFELLALEAEARGLGGLEPVRKSVKQNAVQYMIRKKFDRDITPEKIDDAKVKAFYDGHQEDYHQPEMRRASHILVDDRDEASKLIDEASSADAREFAKLARKHSLDTETKIRGGDLRFFSASGQPGNPVDASVDKRLAQAAFALKRVGDVSTQPVAIDDRWSIVKLTGQRPEEHRSLASVEKGIRMRLWRTQRQQAVNAFVTELRKRYRPKIHPERLDWIKLAPPPMGGALQQITQSKTTAKPKATAQPSGNGL